MTKPYEDTDSDRPSSALMEADLPQERNAPRGRESQEDERNEKEETFRREAVPYLDAVYRFALRLAGSESEAEDLVQETFLRAWRAWDQYTPGTQCKSWLFTICRNYFVRSTQREQRHDELLRENAPSHHAFPLQREPIFSGDDRGDPEHRFFSELVDDRILEAIDALPPAYREAIQLCDVEGMAYEETADVLDVPVGTVKSRLHRGRRILQDELRDYAVSVGLLRPERTGSEPRTDHSRDANTGETVPGPARSRPGVDALPSLAYA